MYVNDMSYESLGKSTQRHKLCDEQLEMKLALPPFHTYTDKNWGRLRGQQ